MALDPYVIHSIVWACLVPFVFLGLLLAFLVLFSYKNIYRSVDVLLLALLPALALDVFGLVLVQGVLYIRFDKNYKAWGDQSCKVYIWAWLWLRLTELFLEVVLSLERVLLLHARRYKHRGSITIKLLAISCWLAAAVVAAVPIIGWEGLDLTILVPYICKYMVYEIDRHYAVFILVFEITAGFLALGCLADTLLHLRTYTRYAKHMSPGLSMANGQVVQNGEDRAVTPEPWDRSPSYSAAYDSCRLVCIILMVIFIVNHIPHALLTLYVVLTGDANEDFRIVSQWLLLVQAAILPTCLWLFSRRYRQGLKHFVQAFLGMKPYFYPGKKIQKVELHTSYMQQVTEGQMAVGQEVQVMSIPVPVQQVINRTRQIDPSAKANPGFESDEEEVTDEMDGRRKKRRAMHRLVASSATADQLSNSSDRSWVLVDGYLMRTKSQEDMEPQPSTSNAEVHSSASGEPTPGPSTIRKEYTASATIPLSHRIHTPDSDSSGSEDGYKTRQHTVFYAYGAETQAEVTHSSKVSHEETAVKGHVNKGFSASELHTNLETLGGKPDPCAIPHSSDEEDSGTGVSEVVDEVDDRGTPSPDSASHLPFYMHSTTTTTTVTAATAASSASAVTTTIATVESREGSVNEESEEGGVSYDDQDIEHVLEGPSVDQKEVKLADGDQNKTDAKKLADLQMSSSLTRSDSPQGSVISSTGSEDLNIVSYMDVNPETVQCPSSTEGSVTEAAVEEYIVPMERNASPHEAPDTSTFIIKDSASVEQRVPSAQGHLSLDETDTTEELYPMSDTGSSRLGSVENMQQKSTLSPSQPAPLSLGNKTQVVLPIHSSDSFHTENPLASNSLQRQDSEVYEDPIIRTVHVRSVSDISDSTATSSRSMFNKEDSENMQATSVAPSNQHKNRHNEVMKELVKSSRTTSYSYSLNLPEKANASQKKEYEVQSLPKDSQTRVMKQTLDAGVLAESDREMHLRQLLQQELNLKFSSDAYLEPQGASTKVPSSTSPVGEKLTNGGVTVTSSHQVQEYRYERSEQMSVSTLQGTGQRMQQQQQQQHPSVEGELFIETGPALKPVPPKVVSDYPEVTVHPAGLYTDNDYRHMEQDLISRGRGRVIGTFPSTISPGSMENVSHSGSPGQEHGPLSPRIQELQRQARVSPEPGPAQGSSPKLKVSSKSTYQGPTKTFTVVSEDTVVKKTLTTSSYQGLLSVDVTSQTKEPVSRESLATEGKGKGAISPASHFTEYTTVHL